MKSLFCKVMWVILTCSVLVFIYFCSLTRRPDNFPPGPPCLPIIGNTVQFARDYYKLGAYHLVWALWSRCYGPIVGMTFAGLNIVVVSGKDEIKEIGSREVFDGRPGGLFYYMRTFGKKIGLVFAEGERHSFTRAAVLRQLKKFGYGTRLTESIITHECQELIKLRLKDNAQPVIVNHMFHVVLLNLLWRIMTGVRFDLNDSKAKEIGRLIGRVFKIQHMSGGLINFMPFLRYIAPGLIGYSEYADIQDKLNQFVEETIDEHKKTIDVNNPRDVMDAIIIDQKNWPQDEYPDEHLHVIFLDLLEAGLETVSNTIEFLIIHLMLNKDVQDKLHLEIDRVIGKDEPKLSHKSRMMYTEAVILETLRISSVASVGIPHMSLEDAKLDRYDIPKGTHIFLAIHDIQHGNHWKEPNKFNPERFLTKEGNVMQDDWFMAFGTGHRRCIGEGVAKMQLFLLVTNIFQAFEIELPPEEPVPSTVPVEGVTLSLNTFKAVFKKRE